MAGHELQFCTSSIYLRAYGSAENQIILNLSGSIGS